MITFAKRLISSMYTEFYKMRNGELADTSDPDIRARLNRAKQLVHRLNTETYLHSPSYREIISELLPHLDQTACITPPFYCDYGDGITIGAHSFINFNCVFLDGGLITIGHHTLIGPNVQIYTPHHPIDYMQRRETKETASPVTVGDDCWIGGGAIILPGVSIGNRCIIGAGSVVTKDVPSDTTVVGNPAHKR